MPYLEVENGHRIQYQIDGEGEPVFLLNGIMMTSEAWAWQRKDLRTSYQVISHDFLGQGQSSMPAHGYSLSLHCAHLEKLMETLEIESAHLLGASYGGEVALLFAAENPKAVRSVTVAGAVSEIHPLLKAMAQAWMVAAATEKGEDFLRLLIPYIYSNTFLKENGSWLEQRVKAFDREVTAEWFQAFRGLLHAFMDLNLTPLLPRIEAPTLVLAGTQDLLKPPYYSEIIARGIPQARLEIMEAGHALPLEIPQQFNSLLLDFLQSNP